jgi:hypothetical protein
MKKTASEHIESYLKFKGIIINDKTVPQVLIGVINEAKEMEKQQQDNYAIEFLEWCENKNVFSPSVIHKPTYNKLLMQFKKEKGL